MTPSTLSRGLLSSAETYPRPRRMVSCISSRPPSSRVAMYASGFIASTVAGNRMSPAVTTPGTSFTSSTSSSSVSP